MSWKKTICSYLLWLIYAVAANLGLTGFLGTVLEREGYSKEYCFPVILVLNLAVALLVFALHRLTVKSIQSEPKAAAWRNFAIVEGILVVALLAGGIFLRTTQIQNLTIGSVTMDYQNPFYEAAKVTEGYVIPQVVHGATYLYLQVLHFVFLLLGNKFIAAVWLQVVLQCLTGVLLYFSVRKLSGRIPAIIMLGFLMLSPYMICNAEELSPETLFFVMYALVLVILTSTLANSKCNPFVAILTGVLIGVCCYFDLSGVTLLLFAVGIVFAERVKPVKWWNYRVIIILGCLLGTVMGWLGVIALDAALCGKKMLGVMAAWCSVFLPKAFAIPINEVLDLQNSPVVWNSMLVINILLMVGIFGFWCRKRRERMGVWTVVAAVFVLFRCFGMMTPQLSGSTYLFFGLVTLAGIGVGDVFSVEMITEAVLPGEDRIGAEEVEEPVETMAEPKTKAVTKEKEIHFLENPLPLPKKHEAKVLDYRFVEIENGDFDYDVAEDDDFDI